MTNQTPARQFQTALSGAMKTIDGLSQGLRLLLASETNTAEAVAGIVANPALHSEVIAALPGLIADRDAAMTRPAMDDLQRIFAPALTIYAMPDRTEGEWAAWWGVYREALADLPRKAIAEAMRQWLRSPAGFFPKPGEIRALALKVPCPEYQVAYWAKLAAEAPKAVTMLDAAERKAQIAEALASLKVKAL
jgi:hypothetical protein